MTEHRSIALDVTAAQVYCDSCGTSFDLPPIMGGVVPGVTHDCHGAPAWSLLPPQPPVESKRRSLRRRFYWKAVGARYRVASWVAGFDVTGR